MLIGSELISPKENRSNTIGCLSVSLAILPAPLVSDVESKLTTKNTVPVLLFIETTSSLSICTSPFAFEVSPLSSIVTLDPLRLPKNNVMVVSEKSVIPS